MRNNMIRLVTIAAVVLYGGVAFAGGTQEGQTDDQSQAGQAADSAYNEAPELAALVDAGELPPVAERLPDEPVVFPVIDEIGNYGGVLRRAWKGPSDIWGLRYVLDDTWGYRNDEGFVEPNLAQDWEMAEDGTSLTVYMRPGLKWSDGHPLTAEDPRFYYEDVVLNEELNPAVPSWAGPIEQFVVVDEYTFRIDFEGSAAYNFLIRRLSNPSSQFLYPAHYLKQFHADYADADELSQLVADGDYTTWTDLFNAKEDLHRSPGRPVVSAWMAVNEPTDPVFAFERNPYYWKIDAEGNQFPYIDRLENYFVESNEVLVLQAMQGNIDLQWRHFSLADFPLMKENEAPEQWEVYLADQQIGASAGLALTLTHVDEVKGTIFRDRRFRQALSLAINRDEINNVNYLGLGKTRQASWPSASPFYDAEWAQAYTAYDPARARKLLDEMGLARDDEGYVLRPDNGDRLVLFLDHFGGFGVTADLELLQIYFEDIGVSTEIRQMERALYEERSESGELDCTVWSFGGVRPDTQADRWAGELGAPFWRDWYESNGERGEEPTDPNVVRLWEIRDALLVTGDRDVRRELMEEVADIYKENLYRIGYVGEYPVPGPLNARLRNFPEESFVYDGWFRFEQLARPFQLFYAE